jgi:hypothetical protein
MCAMVEHVAMTLRRWGWCLCAIVGVAVLVVGVVMLRVGLEKADQLGSMIGSITGVVGLGAAGLALVLAVRADRRDTGMDQSPVVDHLPMNAVIDSTIHGPNIQIGQTGRDIRIEREK